MHDLVKLLTRQGPTWCFCQEAGEMTCSEVHILRKNFWPDGSVALTTNLHAAEDSEHACQHFGGTVLCRDRLMR